MIRAPLAASHRPENRMKPNHACSCVASLVATALAPVIVAWVMGCAAGCGASAPAVHGSGVVATEPREAAGFSEVWLNGSGDVVVEQTGAESVTVEAEDNLLPLLEARVEGRRLTLGSKPNVNLRPTRPIRYHVTVKELTALGVSGSGKFRVEGVDTQRLNADISGSGSATLAGKADDVRLSVSGSGDYDAARLTTRTASVSISGSGSATVNASDEVKADISGSGSVRYLGSPTVEKYVSGSGSIARANQ
jgi:hypothetical protein